MNDLVDTTEMYLRTIYDLEEEGVVPLRARIAERLEQSGPTVSQTVSRMERDGLLHVAGDRHLELTEKGRRPRRLRHAQAPARRTPSGDIIGLPWEAGGGDPPWRPLRRHDSSPLWSAGNCWLPSPKRCCR